MKIKKEVILLALILALGALGRFYKIASIPPGLHGDEAQSGLEALKILNGAPYSPYSPEVFGQTTLYFYWVALIFKLAGAHPVAIRLASAIIGFATLPVFYFLLKKASSTRIALLATFLLAVSRWHLHLSRIGFMTVFMTLFQTLTFVPLILTLKSRTPLFGDAGNSRPIRQALFNLAHRIKFAFGSKAKKKNYFYFFFAGASMGIGLHTYMAFRFVPLIVLPTLISGWFLVKQKTGLKLTNLFLFFLGSLVFALPLLRYALENQDIFLGRMRSIWIFGQAPGFEAWPALKQNLIDTLLMFNLRGSLWPHKNLPGAPMLDLVSGLLFLFGLPVVVRKIKRPLNLLLVSNLVVMSLISVFSITYYPQSGGDPIRSSGALFSVIIIASVGFWSFYRIVSKFINSGLLFAIIAPLGIIVVLLNFKAYFFDFARNPAVWHDFFSLPVSIAHEAQNYSPQKYDYYLLSNWIYGDYLSILFISPDRRIRNHFVAIDRYSPLPPPAVNRRGSVYFVLPFYEKYLNSLERDFPGGILNVKTVGPEEYYFIFEIPPERP